MQVDDQIMKWAMAGIAGALFSGLVALAKFLQHLYKETHAERTSCQTNYAELKEQVGELKGRQDGIEFMSKAVLEEITKLNKGDKDNG